MIRTRPVTPTEVRAYLRKARDFLEVGEMALDHGKPAVATLNAVHATISALDAFSGHFLSARSAATNHEDALAVAATASVPGSSKPLGAALQVLVLKAAAAYEPGPPTESVAQTALKRARRFLEYVEEMVSAPRP